MSKQFVAVVKKIEGLRSEVFRASSSFRAFEVIQEKRAPNIVGDGEASRNAQAIGNFKGFFNIAEQAMKTEFLVSLAKLYDEHPDGTSLLKLIRYISNNIKYLKVDDFADYNKARPDIEARKTDYVGISPSDINALEAELAGLLPLIEKLKRLRDKKIAHLEMKNLEEIEGPKDLDLSQTKIEDLTYEEINKLIDRADKMLNKISSLINRDVAEFRFLKDTVTQDTETLINVARGIYDSQPTGH